MITSLAYSNEEQFATMQNWKLYTANKLRRSETDAVRLIEDWETKLENKENDIVRVFRNSCRIKCRYRWDGNS